MKIGLIAMSGIRACDQELLRLGLTLPGFVERSKVIASLPSLGLLTLAGMTPDHHQLEYLEVPDFNQTLQDQPPPEHFDLVAISTFTAQIDEAYQLCQWYRDRNVKTVLGGLHATSVPGEARQFADAVVVGSGEIHWPQILDDVQNDCLKPLYDAGNQPFDLNQAPMPAFELLDIENYNRLTIQTSRGCPHHCEFCASSVLLTDSYQQKPIEKVIAEINRIIEIWEHPFIEFADDNTFVNKAYWKQLLSLLPPKKMRWFTETDISVADDPELLTLMRQSGCAQVLVGLESPTQTHLNGVELKTNWKLKHAPDYISAIHKIQSHGISVNGCFVLGLDGQTESIFDEVFEFVKKSELHEVQITLQTPFPGTPLYERLLNQDRILEPGNGKKCTLFDLNFRPQPMTVEQLTQGFRDLAVRLYDDDFTHFRRDNFRKFLRQTHDQKKDSPS